MTSITDRKATKAKEATAALYTKARKTAALTALSAAHDEKILGRSRLRSEIEAVLRDKLIELELKESRAANEALAEGLSKTAIGRAMGTSDWGTIEEVLARTAEDVPLEEYVIDPLASRYSFDAEANTLTVTFTGEIWTKACWELDWDERMALSLGLNVAEFEIGYQANGRPILKPTTPNFLPDHGNNHPVVTAVLRNDAEAVEWLEGAVGK